jgi:hypothetical protein
MKRRVIFVVVVLAIGIGVGWYLWPRPVPDDHGPLTLLLYPDVQKELKLSDEQISQTKILVENSWKTFKELGLDKENALKRKKVVRDTGEMLRKMLTPEQFHRLEQLQLQQVGPGAFFDPVVARTIKLSDEQKNKIKTIVENSSLQRFEIYNKGAFKKLARLDKKVLSEITSELNADQKTGFKEILGEPFMGKLPPGSYFLFPKEVQERLER